jgi:hypothetical protein
LVGQLATIRKGPIWGVQLICKRGKVGKLGFKKYILEGTSSLEDHFMNHSNFFPKNTTNIHKNKSDIVGKATRPNGNL